MSGYLRGSLKDLHGANGFDAGHFLDNGDILFKGSKSIHCINFPIRDGSCLPESSRQNDSSDIFSNNKRIKKFNFDNESSTIEDTVHSEFFGDVEPDSTGLQLMVHCIEGLEIK